LHWTGEDTLYVALRDHKHMGMTSIVEDLNVSLIGFALFLVEALHVGSVWSLWRHDWFRSLRREVLLQVESSRVCLMHFIVLKLQLNCTSASFCSDPLQRDIAGAQWMTVAPCFHRSMSSILFCISLPSNRETPRQQHFYGGVTTKTCGRCEVTLAVASRIVLA